MPRPRKPGLDYFPLDCDFFQSKRIKALRRAHKSFGILTYLSILCKVYGGSGYYYRFDSPDELCMDIAEEIAGDQVRRVSTQVAESINYLVEQGTFDRCLFERGVITGKTIQQQYLLSAQAAKRKVDMSLYNLLSGDEIAAGEKSGEGEAGDCIPKNGVSSEETPVNSEETSVNSENNPHSKVIVKLNNTLSKSAHGKYRNVLLTDAERDHLSEVMGDGFAAYLDRFSEKLKEKGYQYADHHGAMLTWWEQDRKRQVISGSSAKSRRNEGTLSSFDTDEFFAAALAKSEAEIREANERAKEAT